MMRCCIRHVMQEHEYGCVIACIAMVTGRSYQEIADDVPRHLCEGDGVHLETMDAVLAGMGYAVARKYAGRGTGWLIEPFASVHICTVSKRGWAGTHAVVMTRDGIVLDPAEPEQRRLNDYEIVHDVAGIVPVMSEVLLADVIHRAFRYTGDRLPFWGIEDDVMLQLQDAALITAAARLESHDA